MGDESDIPSWVNSRSHKWKSEKSNKEGLNRGYECNIVPFCTIQMISSSGEASIPSQQSITSNSWVTNSIVTPTELDETLIFAVSSFGSSLRLFKTMMWTMFELYHPNPPNPNSTSPNLRMYEDPDTKDIFYKDQTHN